MVSLTFFVGKAFSPGRVTVLLEILRKSGDTQVCIRLMNSVSLRSRTEFINKDTDSLISSSIVSTENKTRIFPQQYISYNFYHLTSRIYGEWPTLPSPRQEVCTTYDACRPAMHVNIHQPTVLNGEYFHPTIHVYSWFAPTWHGGHVGGQCNSPFSQ